MTLLAEVLTLLAAAGLGLFVGALLTEAVVLVPVWRTLPPPEFFELHAAHAHRLYAFFAPLTVSATLLSVGAAVAAVATGRPLWAASVVAAVLLLVILSTYVLYFQRANASFAAATTTPEALPAELARWASWHWFRTVIGVVALASGLLALRGGHSLQRHTPQGLQSGRANPVPNAVGHRGPQATSLARMAGSVLGPRDIVKTNRPMTAVPRRVEGPSQRTELSASA